MSKKVRGRRKPIRPESKSISRRKAAVAAAVALSLGMMGVVITQLTAARVTTSTRVVLAAPPAPSLSPGSPSKEYIYASGRLLATEEPSGTPTPPPTPTPTPFPPPAGYRSLSVNGTTAYAQVANSASLNITGAITVEAWVKFDSVGTYQTIVAREGYGAGTGGGYALQINNVGKLRFIIYQNSSSYVDVVGQTVIPTGEWHHVAGVYDGTATRSVFVDGVEDGGATSTTGPTPPGSGTAGLTIGRRSSGNSNYFGGKIDEVRVSDSALHTAAEPFTPETSLTAGATTKGLWKFDGENVNDASGLNSPGSLQGGAAYSPDVPVVSEYSLSLNGTSSYANVPYQSNSNTNLNLTGPLTVEAWINYGSTTSYQTIVARENYGVTNGGGGYALQITPTGKLRFILYQSESAFVAVAGSTTIPEGSWHHVAGVFDGTNLKVYLDGAENGSLSPAAAPGPGTAALTIGRRNASNTYYFKGRIDEVRVSTGALYLTNFNHQALKDLSPTSGVTRGLWKFNDQQVTDFSNNGNAGAAQGGAFFSTNVP